MPRRKSQKELYVYEHNLHIFNQLKEFKLTSRFFNEMLEKLGEKWLQQFVSKKLQKHSNINLDI